MKRLLMMMGIATLLFTTNSCKKEGVGNPLADVANLGQGSYLTLVKNVNLNLNYASIATSVVSITVGSYGGEVDKINVYVVRSANSDPASWKLIKTVPYTGTGTVLSATGAEVATALGTTPANLSPGNYYTFYNQLITKDGRKYDLTNTGNFESISNYNMAMRWTAYVVCPFTSPIAGTYKVLRDDWQDWNPGDLVQVTDGPGANVVNLSKVWPNAAYGNIVSPLLVNVDPATGTATVPLVTFANNYPGTATAQGAGANNVAGYVFSCTGYITLTMKVLYNGGSQGNLTLILQKQ